MKVKFIINNYMKGTKLKTTPRDKIVSINKLQNNKHEIIYELSNIREKEFIEKVFAKKGDII